MATSNILATASAVNSFTITLGTLASSTSGVGRQSTMVNNHTTQARRAIIYLTIKSGGSAPTVGLTYDVFLLRGDNQASSTYRTDGAGASDAAITIENAVPLGSIKVTATTNKLFYGEFDTADVTNDLGDEWGIAVVNASGQALNASSHVASYVTMIDQAQ